MGNQVVIGKGSGASFLHQSQSELKQKQLQSQITSGTQLQIGVISFES